MTIKPRQTEKALAFFQLSRDFWLGSTRWRALQLTAAIIALLAMNLMVNLGMNKWSRWFFDTLEGRKHGLVPGLLGLLLLAVFAGAACAVAMIHYRMTLQLEWRRWLTTIIMQRWEARGVTRSIPFPMQGSPEFRLVEDIRLAIDPAVEMTIGLLNACILGATFISVLVVVGGGQQLAWNGATVEIPGIFALAALAYAAVVSSTMHWIGRPLIRAVSEKNEAEGRFLFELTGTAERLSEQSADASVSTSFQKARNAFADVIRRWAIVIQSTRRLTWIGNSSAFFAPSLPLLIAMPKYLRGDLSLGAVMQVAAAFVLVLGAMNWFTDNYVRFAEWAASAQRVAELYHAVSTSSEDGKERQPRR